MTGFNSSFLRGVLFCTLFVLLLGFIPAWSQNPTLEFVMQVQARHERALFQLAGVRGVGISAESGHYVLRVFVNVQAGQPSLPTELEGVPVRAKQMFGDFVALADDGFNHRESFPTPVPTGVSTSHFRVLCIRNSWIQSPGPSDRQCRVHHQQPCSHSVNLHFWLSQ